MRRAICRLVVRATILCVSLAALGQTVAGGLAGGVATESADSGVIAAETLRLLARG